MLLDANGNPISSGKISLRKLTFKELPRHIKVMFAGASAIAATIALLLANIQSIRASFSTPFPVLSLEDTTISDDGYAARVDMFILNKGDARALVTRARIHLLEEVRVMGHGVHGAPMAVDVPYDVTLTLGKPDDVITDVPDLARDIAPGDGDRISFNFFTQDFNSDGMLIAYKIQIELTYNDSTELKSPVITIGNPLGIYAFFDGIPVEVNAQIPAILEKLRDGDPEHRGLVVKNIINKLDKIAKDSE